MIRKLTNILLLIFGVILFTLVAKNVQAIYYLNHQERLFHQSSPTSIPYLMHKSVSIFNFQFIPQELVVEEGTTVTWTNYDQTPHTTTSDNTSSDSWDSGRLNRWQSFSVTFNKTGTYHYHCSIHPHMHGIIKVVKNSKLNNNIFQLSPGRMFQHHELMHNNSNYNINNQQSYSNY